MASGAEVRTPGQHQFEQLATGLAAQRIAFCNDGLHGRPQRSGQAYFAVAYTSEGIALRKAGITLPILVLHPQPINFNDIVKYNLEPTLYSQRIAQLFLDYAKIQQLANYPVHLKCNTGLNRLGFDLNEIEETLILLKNNTTIRVKTAYSHLAASEDMNEKEFTEN